MIPLFTVLYGSTLYGTNTPTSDRDVKNICLPLFRDAILGKVPKNKVKGTNDPNQKNGVDDVDEENIPLQVFAKDFMEGQTYALELAFAVEYNKAEQNIHHPLFPTFCRQLRAQFMTSSMNAMVHYATNQAVLYSNKGERLNAAVDVKSLLATFNYQSVPQTDKMALHWDELLKQIQPLIDQYPTCVKIVDCPISRDGQDTRPAIDLLERMLLSTGSFATAVKTIDSVIAKYGARAKAAQADQVDWKATSHALRIINEGIELLSGRPLVYPYPKEYAQYLLAIKLGTRPHQEVMTEITVRMDELKRVQALSSLQPLDKSLYPKLEEFVYEWLLTFYSRSGEVLDPSRVIKVFHQVDGTYWQRYLAPMED